MSPYLLDTCAFVWLCAEPDRLSDAATAIVDEPETTLILSDVTPLEITLKWTAGKIQLPDPPRLWIESQIAAWSLECHGIQRDDIYRSAELPNHHRDPFDRLLIASALNLNATILTPDEAIQAYPVSCRW